MDKEQEFCDRMEELGRRFAPHAADHDEKDGFVAGNFAALR